ncbi:hypothetical protein [Asanoa hainanensis]|nr:hypothetical protein [Asanoa hainanensis]
MEQTFTDLRRERAGVLWIFTETFAGIVRERATDLGRLAMTSNVFRIVKFAALAVAGLMVAGIVTVMLLARGTGEDITGVVAPALLLVVLSVVAFVVATVMQGRQRKRDVAG